MDLNSNVLPQIKIHKKRGRKPKNKDDNCLIAHIPLKDKDIQSVLKLTDSDSLSDVTFNTKKEDCNKFNMKYISCLESKISSLTDKIKHLESQTNKNFFLKIILLKGYVLKLF